MRFPLMLVILVILLALSIFIGCDNDPISSIADGSNDSSNNARLTIENPVFDFGFAPQYSKISHDFWLKSTGTDTLRILKVQLG